MLDFNHRASLGDLVTDLINAGLEAEHRSTPPRKYLGGSRLGVPCDRALQFEYAQAPKDEGADFDGRTLRIFAAGHIFEDLAVRWLRSAGLDLYTRKGNRPDGSVLLNRKRPKLSRVTQISGGHSGRRHQSWCGFVPGKPAIETGFPTTGKIAGPHRSFSNVSRQVAPVLPCR